MLPPMARPPFDSESRTDRTPEAWLLRLSTLEVVEFRAVVASLKFVLGRSLDPNWWSMELTMFNESRGSNAGVGFGIAPDSADKLMELSVVAVTADRGSGPVKVSETSTSATTVVERFLGTGDWGLLIASGLLRGPSLRVGGCFECRDINASRRLVPFRRFAKTTFGCLMALHSFLAANASLPPLGGASVQSVMVLSYCSSGSAELG